MNSELLNYSNKGGSANKSANSSLFVYDLVGVQLVKSDALCESVVRKI